MRILTSNPFGVSRLKRGDHFFVWRRQRGIAFQHHGIYVGDGDAVHFTDGVNGVAGPGGASSQFEIQRTRLDVVTRGGTDVPNVVRHSRRFDADQVVERALSRVGGRGYHLVFDNCEHFATWCIVDRHESRQISVAYERMSSAGVKTVAAGSLKLASKLGAKGIVRGVTPWLLVSDAIQFATEAAGHHVGLTDPKKRKQASRAAGIGTALGIGAIGGPLGAVVAGGVWCLGEAAGELSRTAYEAARIRRVSQQTDLSASDMATSS